MNQKVGEFRELLCDWWRSIGHGHSGRPSNIRLCGLLCAHL